jgi:hypothetical protein
MDEFLEFHPQVLEALREPVEHGRIELARVGQRQRFPARFQLVGTTNLCICGKLNPLGNRKCGYSLARCRSTLGRLSGPVLDRFDMMCLSHEWSGKGERWEFERMLTEVQALSDFASGRGAGAETAEDVMSEIPEWVKELPLGYRRWRSLRRRYGKMWNVGKPAFLTGVRAGRHAHAEVARGLRLELPRENRDGEVPAFLRLFAFEFLGELFLALELKLKQVAAHFGGAVQLQRAFRKNAGDLLFFIGQRRERAAAKRVGIQIHASAFAAGSLGSPVVTIYGHVSHFLECAGLDGDELIGCGQ